MLRVLFYIGLFATVASSIAGYDFSRQLAKEPAQQLEMSAYLANVPVRAAALLEPKPADKARGMSLPQISGMTYTSGTQHIDQFASGSSSMGALVRADRAAAKESWWERRRQKAFDGSDAGAGKGRFADIKSRTQP
ncbi:MAG: hypothetical protein AAF307_06860 [Pseudomonadota bacterium]